MSFFEPCSTMPVWKACLLAIAPVIAALGTSTIFNEVLDGLMFIIVYNILSVLQYLYRITVIGTKMRIAYMGLIFRKVSKTINIS